MTVPEVPLYVVPDPPSPYVRALSGAFDGLSTPAHEEHEQCRKLGHMYAAGACIYCDIDEEKNDGPSAKS